MVEFSGADKPIDSARPMGWRLPPEWSPQVGVWLSWPAVPGVSFPLGFEGVQEAFAKFVAAVTRFEAVFLLVGSEDDESIARAKISGRRSEGSDRLSSDFYQ